MRSVRAGLQFWRPNLLEQAPGCTLATAMLDTGILLVPCGNGEALGCCGGLREETATWDQNAALDLGRDGAGAGVVPLPL